MDIRQRAKAARRASIELVTVNSYMKHLALTRLALYIRQQGPAIIAENALDVSDAVAAGIAEPLIKRLKVDEGKVEEMAAGLDALALLEDPVSRTLVSTELAPELELFRVSCPIGVIGAIFESRPDALVQIAALCLKSGNAVMLKGGSEAARTNKLLSDMIVAVTNNLRIPADWLTLLTTRDEVADMLTMHDCIDLIIPRGSNEFVRHIMDNSRIPVMGHAAGLCHVYVDEHADIDMALNVTTDAKTQYVAVCNAAETLLVHQAVSRRFLPQLKLAMDARGVELIGCAHTRAVIDCAPATPEAYDTEYLDLKMSVKVVRDIGEAIDHINVHGSGHTDAIITNSRESAKRFTTFVDSAGVYVNCSTRFSDGFRYGLGAEVGVSTGKVHARGPVGLEGLMTYKYVLVGNGQTVEDFSSGRKKFTHKKLLKDFSI